MMYDIYERYEQDGIIATWTSQDRRVDVSGFEIEESKIMNFGETAYIDAVARFVETLRAMDVDEIYVRPMRSGYQMLLARFGFDFISDDENHRGFMRWIQGMPETPSPAAHTFNRISGSSFEPHLKILLSDGRQIPISELDVGHHVAGGGLVTGILTGKQRMGVQLGEHRFSASGAVMCGGEWIRMEDHPEAKPLYEEKGWIGKAIKTEHHQLVVEGYLFADFMESEERVRQLKGLSDQAIELMNAEHSNG